MLFYNRRASLCEGLAWDSQRLLVIKEREIKKEKGRGHHCHFIHAQGQQGTHNKAS